MTSSQPLQKVVDVTDRTTDIDAILADMILAEKIGQMTQVSNDSITPAEVADHFIGSVLSGGEGNPTPNTPVEWVDMVGGFVDAAAGSRLGVPLIYGIDAVHGHSNVRGATIFPHNIGLGSAADPDLVERIGRATATEMLATGVRWAFAPTVAVPQDLRWGRTYEGYGRDPVLVATLGAALVRGLQGQEIGTVLACPKHFVADGATSWDTAPRFEWTDWWDGWGDVWRIDQGDARITEHELRAVHLPPYRAAIDAGAMTVMASYSSWQGVRLHEHHRLLTEVLKGELGFGGFVVTDWMGIDQIGPNYDEAVVKAINAGIDMVMVPIDYTRFLNAMKRAVADGDITMRRIDDAVRRILTAKAAAGLFDSAPVAPPLSVIGSATHRGLASEAVRRSATLLKNDRALPLSPTTRTIRVAGPAADDIGLQCGGWTVGWQGGIGATTEGTTLLEGLRNSVSCEVAYDPSGIFPDGGCADVGVICIAEPPYAEGPGDCVSPEPSSDDRAIFSRMRASSHILILVVYSGRPLVMPDLIERADAVVAAWLPGTEASALGELLAGRHPFEARTPQPWPRSSADLGDRSATPLFDSGHGLEAAVGPVRSGGAR